MNQRGNQWDIRYTCNWLPVQGTTPLHECSRSRRLRSGCLFRFIHAAAEDTALQAESADLVSICLVMHELPQSATRAIIAEAYRLLRPGGTFSVMVLPILPLKFHVVCAGLHLRASVIGVLLAVLHTLLWHCCSYALVGTFICWTAVFL